VYSLIGFEHFLMVLSGLDVTISCLLFLKASGACEKLLVWKECALPARCACVNPEECLREFKSWPVIPTERKPEYLGQQ
jgi:hypothetical protein